jgi:hypothetical protein
MVNHGKNIAGKCLLLQPAALRYPFAGCNLFTVSNQFLLNHSKTTHFQVDWWNPFSQWDFRELLLAINTEKYPIKKPLT